MTYDVVVVGSGPEGLACAALTARAGRKVLVLEPSSMLGGLAAPREFAAGYRVPGVVHDLGRPDPRLEPLDLARHGLVLRAAPLVHHVPERGGPGLSFDRDPKRLARELGPRANGDPERYARLCALLDRIGPTLQRLLARPAPDVARLYGRELLPLVRQAFDLRRLGKRDLTELLRFAPMPATDWVGEHLTDELARTAFIAPALTGTRNGPRAPHGALFVALAHVLHHRGFTGGPAAFVGALAASARADGAELRTDQALRRVHVVDGRAHGVELADGEVVAARHVVAACDPRTALLDLLPPRSLPSAVRAAARAWRSRGELAKLHVALAGPLELVQRAGERFEALWICDGLDGLEKAADAAKYDELPARPALELRVPSLAEPTLAPTGHAVLSIALRTVPHTLRSGWDDAARAALVERTLDLIAEHAPTVRGLVVAHELLTPADLEREYGARGGHVLAGELGLDQASLLRPGAQLSRGRTPIEGYLLASAGVHPGPFLLGGPGAQAAEAITGA